MGSRSPWRVNDDLLAECIHCGLCLETCPTFVETGREEESPRGRIHLLRDLAQGRWGPERGVLEPLENCLGCRACETACPSGVHYGRLLEDARAEARERGVRPRSRWENRLVRHLAWRGELLERLAPVYRGLRLWKAARILASFGGFPRSWRHRLALAPRPEPRPVGHPQPSLPPQAPQAILLRGCVSRAFYPATESATADLLTAAGYRVTRAGFPSCCGALAQHLGERELARHLGRELLSLPLEEGAVLVPTAAGCGAHLKGLAHLFHEPHERDLAHRLSSRVKDPSQALLGGPHPVRFRNVPPEPVLYHDACHLRHGQGISDEPRQLLRAAGAQVVEPPNPDLCCGSAGSYNLAREEMGARLGRRKAADLLSTGVPVVVTTNPGCLIQLESHLGEAGPRILSWARYLAERLDTGGPCVPRGCVSRGGPG